MHEHLSIEIIAQKIFFIRGKKVMFDKDIAILYGVKAIALRQQVKRNSERFPQDFMFQLSIEETKSLLSQNVIASKKSLGGARPYVFTEQGIAMLSGVLTSSRAVRVNIQIMRTFTKLRELMISHKDLAYKIESLERKFKEHDGHFKIVFEAIKQLLEPPRESKVKIGFHP